MGELHLDVLVTRITQDFNVDARIGNPQVTYRESIKDRHSHTEVYEKVLGGKENFASVTLRVEPLDRGSGNQFRSELKKSALPQDLVEAVQRGVTNAFSSGIMYGYPCYDVGVVLESTIYDELKATPLAFESCCCHGL